MVAVAGNDYNIEKYQATPGLGFDGVVLIDAGNFYGTGVLLWDGLHVLTAAHVVNGAGSLPVIVGFETSDGRSTLIASETICHLDYDSHLTDNDLALITLPEPAPLKADRYQIYRDADEAGHNFILSGYGKPGIGSVGTSAAKGDLVRRMASNTFESSLSDLKSLYNDVIDWSHKPGNQLIADFDNGWIKNDAGYQFMGISCPGLGSDEGFVSPGDSGGPAFINNEIAGIASYIFSMTDGNKTADVDALQNSSFGEFASWQRVSEYSQWIDQNIRKDYENAPSKPSEVKIIVSEGDGSTSLAWFLVELKGIEAKYGGSIFYRTVDGSAEAGSDYIAASGKLVFYPGETHVAIPVEIIGDRLFESNENFFMEIYDPVGGVFPDGKTVLTAMRTIVDDDAAVTLNGIVGAAGYDFFA